MTKCKEHFLHLLLVPCSFRLRGACSLAVKNSKHLVKSNAALQSGPLNTSAGREPACSYLTHSLLSVVFCSKLFTLLPSCQCGTGHCAASVTTKLDFKVDLINDLFNLKLHTS